MKEYYVYKSALRSLLVLLIIYVNITTSCLEHERIGLLGLRQLLESNGVDSSTHLLDWTEDSQIDCCKWERVTCDNGTGHVTRLFLSNFNDFNYDYYRVTQVWSINCSLFLPFTELQSLNLSFNPFAQWEANYGFEMLSALKKLEILDLSFNNFNNNTIFHYLGAITSLKMLLLSNNVFKGSFPTYELSGLVNLKTLDLSSNGYEDWSPKKGFEKLSVFNKLENLNLGYNDFTLAILPYLNSVTSLKVLSLRETWTYKEEPNEFSGLFPGEELGNLWNLEILDLSNNGLSEIQGGAKPVTRRLRSLVPETSSRTQFLYFTFF